MSESDATRVDLAALLREVEDAPPAAVPQVFGDHLGRALGATDVALLLADLAGRALVRLTQPGDGGEHARRTEDEAAGRVPLADSPQGVAMVRQGTEVRADGDGAWVYAPVTNRGEAIGVLELRLPFAPGEAELADVAHAAHALAYVIIANGRFTDLFEWGQRSRPLSLAAEIQRRLLPGSYTCEAGQATIAGWLQPAAEVAGDTFDFSVERDTLHLSITDAMGHAVDAALLATTVVGALRNARRAGATLEEQADGAAAALTRHAGDLMFATGQLVRIDLASGHARVVNAGHPPPLRLRGGEVLAVELQAQPPFGTVPDHEYRAFDFALEPGDRLFFLTDGMLERNAAAVDVQSIVSATAGEHPREAIQRLMHTLLDETDGELKDDATAMCVEWHGPDGDRETSGGAGR